MKRPSSQQQFIQNDAEGINVGLGGRLDARGDQVFGGHVFDRAATIHCRIAQGHLGIGLGGNPKVQDLELLRRGSRIHQHDVLQFQVAMHQPLGMGMLQRAADLEHELAKQRNRQGQQLVQSASIQILHDDEGNFRLDVAHVVDADDVGMLEFARDAGLDRHAFRKLGLEHLDGHPVPVEIQVFGLEHVREPAPANPADQPVAIGQGFPDESLSKSHAVLRILWRSPGDGTSTAVAADATKNVDADAGSIRHVAPDIDSPVPTTRHPL